MDRRVVMSDCRLRYSYTTNGESDQALLYSVGRPQIPSCVEAILVRMLVFFFFSSRRRHTRCSRDWSSGRVLFRSQGVQPKAKAKPSKKPLHAVGGATELRRWTSRLSQRDSAGPKRPMMESEKK